MKVTVEIVKIGPKQAEQLLSSQVKEQRNLRDSHVNSLAREMTNGDFRLSADALVVIKGQLANGQHRMWAIIESGTTQQFLLMTTDDDELYKVIDCGLKRTIGDAVHISNSTAIAAIAKIAMSYERGLLSQYAINAGKRPCRVESIEYIQKHLQALQDAHAASRTIMGSNALVCPVSAIATLLFIARAHGDKPAKFLSQLCTGTEPDGIAYDLRERFIKMRMGKARYSTPYFLALMIKCFNSYVNGTKLGQIKMNEDEAYPKITPPTKS